MSVRVLDERDGLQVPMISKDARLVAGPHVGARLANMNVVRLEPGEMNQPHAHTNSEDSIFILEGHGSVHDLDNGVTHALRTGSAVLVPPGLRHAVQGGEPAGLRSVGGPVPPDWEMLRAIGLRSEG
jgi:quercetin dioxygenase-like cupin family protein